MPTRSAWVLLVIVCLGCDPLLPLTPSPDGSAAQQLWQQGQEALLAGRTDDGITLYQRSLTADPGLTRNHLSLAAAYLEKGDNEQACVHLEAYVATNPEHAMVHVHLAELLARLNRHEQAREEFERFIALAQDQPRAETGERIHCHSRLVDLAEAAGDEYAEHLNRGIGLYLLAQERAALDGPESELSTEGLLFRAAAELSVAVRQRPEEARPRWYLYRVWSDLGQPAVALRWLAQADAAAPFSYLTPAETEGLQLAWHCRHDPARR